MIDVIESCLVYLLCDIGRKVFRYCRFVYREVTAVHAMACAIHLSLLSAHVPSVSAKHTLALDTLI